MHFLLLENKPYGLMRVKEASKYIEVSKATLRRLVLNGEIPAIVPSKNAPWLLDVQDLDNWKEKNKTNPGK